jgi:hypothetical protein
LLLRSLRSIAIRLTLRLRDLREGRQTSSLDVAGTGGVSGRAAVGAGLGGFVLHAYNIPDLGAGVKGFFLLFFASDLAYLSLVCDLDEIIGKRFE